MDKLILDNNFLSSINFFDSILFIESFTESKKVYNMVVDYFKKENGYLLKLNILEDNNEIFNTECKLTSKINGSIVIKDIINLVTHKYNNDLVIDVKEIDKNNNCINLTTTTATTAGIITGKSPFKLLLLLFLSDKKPSPMGKPIITSLI